MRRPFALVLSLSLAAVAGSSVEPLTSAIVQNPATGGSGAQDPTQPGTDSRDRPPLTQFREQRAAELLADIDGSWRLTRFLHSTSAIPSDSVVGFAILHAGYGTIVINAYDYPEDALEPEYLVQATAFQYRFDSNLRLQTSTVLGHHNFIGELVFEDSLTPREFNAEILGDTLILTRPDGSRLQFQRSVNDAFPEKTLLLMQQQRGRNTTPTNSDF